MFTIDFKESKKLTETKPNINIPTEGETLWKLFSLELHHIAPISHIFSLSIPKGITYANEINNTMIGIRYSLHTKGRIMNNTIQTSGRINRL